MTATLSRRGRNCKKHTYSNHQCNIIEIVANDDGKLLSEISIRCTVMFRTNIARPTNLRKRCVHFLLSRSLTNEVNATTRSRAKREALLMKPVGKFGLPVSRTDINAMKTGGIELASM